MSLPPTDAPAGEEPTSPIALFDQVRYGERFLQDYAGSIISDPKVAICELIANAHDAGATRVDVSWPAEPEGVFSVADNGTGMTKDEFLFRWSCLTYDRIKAQGVYAEFPPTVKAKGQRPVFGQYGKGRFAPFCFADEYRVLTTRDGVTTCGTVALPKKEATSPFRIALQEADSGVQHGTTVSWTGNRRGLRESALAELISTVFLLDPQFAIALNGSLLDLGSLDGVTKEEVPVEPYGVANVYLIDTKDARKHNRPGIAWRVRTRLVGEPGWREFDEDGIYPNGRPSDSKRFCFVVEADFLKRDVKQNWKGFRDNEKTTAVRSAVFEYIARIIRVLTHDSVRKRQTTAIQANGEAIKTLPRLSLGTVQRFITEVQSHCPRLSQTELNSVVQILVSLEQARSGYGLLSQLKDLPPDDLDRWNGLMKTWVASQAEAVLDEIERRLSLIRRLQSMMKDRTTDEVHDLLPLFGRVLWMFGPEFEAAGFQSNRTLASIINDMLGGTSRKVPNLRPDIVATANGYILPFTLDGFDADGEVGPIAKLLVIELKKGGFTIGMEETSQPKRYILQLRKAGHVGPSTAVTAYVLGWDIGEEAVDEEFGNQEPKARIYPRTYNDIIRKAEARTFHLKSKIEALAELPAQDADFASALGNVTPSAFE